MMQSEMVEKQLRRITVHAHSVKDVDDLIFFICTDTLREDANAVNVMQLAHFYQMKRLLAACTKRAADTLSLDTFAQTAKMFDKYEIGAGYLQTLIDFGRQNIADLRKRDDYETM